MLLYIGAVNNPHQLLLKYYVKISAAISVLEYSIDGQSNIGNWTNIGEKKLKISVSVSTE